MGKIKPVPWNPLERSSTVHSNNITVILCPSQQEFINILISPILTKEFLTNRRTDQHADLRTDTPLELKRCEQASKNKWYYAMIYSTVYTHTSVYPFQSMTSWLYKRLRGSVECGSVRRDSGLISWSVRTIEQQVHSASSRLVTIERPGPRNLYDKKGTGVFERVVIFFFMFFHGFFSCFFNFMNITSLIF